MQDFCKHSEKRGGGRPPSVIAKAVIGLIGAYKLIVSPLVPAACRHHPTCSEYSMEAICRHGAVLGGALSLRRILRCNPLFPGGPDPVP